MVEDVVKVAPATVKVSCKPLAEDFMDGPERGKILGQFDLPENCGHAGGLAYIGKGILIVADTRKLYKINERLAFTGQNNPSAVMATVKLKGQLKGSFVDFDGSSIFIGSYEKDIAKAKGYFLPLSIFDTDKDKTIDEAIAIQMIPILVLSQGAAFDKEGHLWISASTVNLELFINSLARPINLSPSSRW